MTITITPAASERMHQFLAQTPGAAGVRFGVKRTGCSGFGYVVDLAQSVGEGDRLSIVGWHAPILAPKERDLMFIGGGVGNAWNQPRQQALFYEGYGPSEIDAVALAYYRYERITRDVLELCDRILDSAKANANASAPRHGAQTELGA